MLPLTVSVLPVGRYTLLAAPETVLFLTVGAPLSFSWPEFLGLT